MVTDLGGNCAHRIAAEGRAAAAAPEPGAGPVWLRENDPLVSQNEFCNTDIRSHLKELFTFTLFFAPRTIVRVHRCARLAHLIMHRVPSRGGVLCVCKQA